VNDNFVVDNIRAHMSFSIIPLMIISFNHPQNFGMAPIGETLREVNFVAFFKKMSLSLNNYNSLKLYLVNFTH